MMATSNFRLLKFCLLNVGESQALVPSAGIILTCTPAPKHQWFLHKQPSLRLLLETFLLVSFVLGGTGGLTDLFFLVAGRKR